MTALVASLLASLPVRLPLAKAGGRSRPHRPDVMPVSEVRPGMKGYGLTVFEGTRPERFGVEVIDVIKNFRPDQDAILIKTDHPRLDVVNVVRGMSGSPIFIDDKMIGAYAYGWSFGKEPVAGVTPIQDMLDDLDRPLPKEIFGWPLELRPATKNRPPARPNASRPPSGPDRFAGAPGDYRLDAHAAQLAARSGAESPTATGLRRLATPVLLGGMGTAATAMARELLQPLGLEPLQAGGGGAREEDAPLHYEDGGALAVELISGDINATPLGTVTRVEGDRLVAFGHPMMNGGVTAMPTAVGRVLWVMASEAASFKMGMAVRPLGALVNDRQASIVVSESAQAPVIPVQLDINGVPGAPKTQWRFDIAHDRFMTPSFLAMALGNAMQATGADRRDVSWRAESKVKIQGHGELVLEDFGVSVGGTPDPREFVRSALVAAVGGILNNPWSSTLVESVSTRIDLSYSREILRLRGVRLLETEIEAGQAARMELTLIPFAGPPRTRIIEVPLPRNLAGKTVQLSIQPGHSLERVKAPPETLAEFIQNLENPIYPPRAIVVSHESGSGVAFKGRVAKNLPPGAFDSIQQRAASFAPQPFQSKRRHVVMLPGFMVGSDSVSVKVLPKLR